MLKYFDVNKYFSVFHLSIYSLQYHKNDLEILLDFDIIPTSETKLQRGVKSVHNIVLPNYQMGNTQTEASRGGTHIKMSNLQTRG